MGMELIGRSLKTNRARRATLHGREHVVVPLTMIVPGVLNGSQGPLFYPEEEIRRNYADWNGIPIVVGHPVAADGNQISARSPEILDRQGIGRVYKTTANGKLKAEGWFDVANVKRVRPELLSRLESGQPVELSTGLFTDNEPAKNGASHRGRSYSHVARNYRPDHLAILLDQEGACSVRDGCGVNVNQRRQVERLPGWTEEEWEQLAWIVENKWSDVARKAAALARRAGSASASAGKRGLFRLGKKLVQKYGTPPSLPQQKAPNVARFKQQPPPLPESGFRSAPSRIQSKPSGKSSVARGKGSLQDVLSRRASPPSEKRSDPQGRKKTPGPVEPGYSKTERGRRKTSGGRRKAKAAGSIPDEVRAAARRTAQRTGIKMSKRFARTKTAGQSRYPSTKSRGRPISRPQSTGAGEVSRWTAGKPGMRFIRNEDGTLTIEAKQKIVTNLLKELMPTDDRRKRPIHNSEGGRDMSKKRLTDDQRKSVLDNLISNCADCGWVEDDRETLNAMPDEKLMTMEECRKKMLTKNQALVDAERAKVAAETKVAELTANAEKAKKDGQGDEQKNEPKKLTTEEVVALLPDEMKANLAFGGKSRTQWRAQTIKHLTANVEDDGQKDRLTKKLEKAGDEILEDMLLVAPAAKQDQEPAANYAGASTGYVPVSNKSRLTFMGLPGEVARK